MTNQMNQPSLKDRLAQLNQQKDRSKLYLQELNSETQKTINDLLVLTGRIFEVEEMLKEPEQPPSPEQKDKTNARTQKT